MQATPSRHVAKGIDGCRVADDACRAYRFRIAAHFATASPLSLTIRAPRRSHCMLSRTSFSVAYQYFLRTAIDCMRLSYASRWALSTSRQLVRPASHWRQQLSTSADVHELAYYVTSSCTALPRP